MKIEEILIIKNGSESFGISTQDINQIFRVPDIMPLPLRPEEVRGLSVLGGNIATVRYKHAFRNRKSRCQK